MKGLTGKRLGYIPPGSEEWRGYMTASKIAAVMGHSPYQSRFALWHEMAGTIPPKPQTTDMARGHYLEPAIVEWFSDQHPEVKVYRTAMYRHAGIGWAAATPDRIIRYGDGRTRPEGLEAKSADNPWEWGEPGTDQIPPYYYDQCVWQAGVLGFERVRVAALFTNLRFAEYVVEFNLNHFSLMLGEAEKFMTSLRDNEKPTIDPLDGHMDTYRAIRYLHPEINLEEVEVPQQLAMQVQCAVLDKERNDQELTALKSQLTELMGSAKDAKFNGIKIARRQAKGDGTPFVVIPPALKKANLIIEEEEGHQAA